MTKGKYDSTANCIVYFVLDLIHHIQCMRHVPQHNALYNMTVLMNSQVGFEYLKNTFK